MIDVSPEWVGIILTAVISGGASVGSGLVIFWKIATGQAVAKERENRHTADIVIINNKLDTIVNGESKCKLDFTAKIATLQQKTESIQSELTEEKGKNFARGVE